MVERMPDENYQDFFVRLCDHKLDSGMTWEDIADILNRENGVHYDSSAYRKEYAAFNRGRIYERQQQSNGVCKKILATSDFHVPFQIKASAFANYAGVDVLVLNGDIEDCQSISKFQKYHRIPLIDEMIETRQYIIDLINVVCPAEVVITYGNHEKRLSSYMANRLDTDMLALLPDTPLDMIINTGFRKYDKVTHTEMYYPPLRESLQTRIVYVKNWWCKIGRTIFAHPLTYSSAMLKTTEKAVNYFLRQDRDFDALVLAHTHRLGSYIQGGISMYEQGACCDVNALEYTDGNLTMPQQAGCVMIYQDKDGAIIPNLTKIIQFGGNYGKSA